MRERPRGGGGLARVLAGVEDLGVVVEAERVKRERMLGPLVLRWSVLA